MIRRRFASTLLVAALVAGGLGLSLQETALAQQAPQLTSRWVATLPADPADPAWQQATAVDVPLIPQAVALPRLAQMSVPTIAVRSLNDGTQIAFRLEWADATQDVHATRPDQFSDAAAMLFAISNELPNICMGAPGQLTNIWHWKADWQDDINHGFYDVPDAYPNFFKDTYPFVSGQAPYRAISDFTSPEAQQYFIGLAAGNARAVPQRQSPVEELLSAGFGTATHKQQQNTQGKGAWAGDRWQVMFTRSLQTTDPDAVNLAGARTAPVAFAVWNGANQEVGARKQLSSFLTMRIGTPPPAQATPAVPPPDPLAWIGMGIAVAYALLLAGAGIWALGQRNRAK